MPPVQGVDCATRACASTRGGLVRDCAALNLGQVCRKSEVGLAVAWAATPRAGRVVTSSSTPFASSPTRSCHLERLWRSRLDLSPVVPNDDPFLVPPLCLLRLMTSRQPNVRLLLLRPTLWMEERDAGGGGRDALAPIHPPCGPARCLFFMGGFSAPPAHDARVRWVYRLKTQWTDESRAGVRHRLGL
jgi:hypothetical protein